MKVLLALVPLLFSGCIVEQNQTDLEQFVQRTLARPAGKIESIPPFQVYEYYSYSAASKRSPFDLPVITSKTNNDAFAGNVEPNLSRQKEPLESVALSDLTMVGTIQMKDGELWALVKNSNGSITRVKKGNYMGHNHGHITQINADTINLIEIVPNGVGGWLERPRNLALNTKAGE